MDRIAITGAGGQVGSSFVRALGPTAVALDRRALDVAEIDRIPEALANVEPTKLINCAAYTKVDQAEEEETLATRVNSEAVEAMAKWTTANDIPFVTFSTDYVFGGNATTPYTESSPINPKNAYGRSKVEGERAAIEAGGLVVRTSWVISGTHPNFVATILRMSRNKKLRVVDDQLGRPTIADDLAATTLQLLDAGASGLFHVANLGPTTWYDLAQAALSEAGIDGGQVQRCATSDYPTPAPRPAYSVLASERLGQIGVEDPPHWRTSLPGVVSQILAWI